MTIMLDSINPRHLREKYSEWVGKKVTVGLTTFHYLCGHWKAIDGQDALFTVGSKELRVKLQEIASVAESPEAQAEFIK
jgi:hypothetical protein